MAPTQHGHRRTRSGNAWWRPAAYSAAAAAAVAALFNPLPALADPAVGQPAIPGSVPDSGSRPIPAGAVVLPGQSSATTTTPITTSALAGSTNPILQKIQKGRDEVATLGDQLIQLGQDRDTAKTQQASTEQRYTQAENDLLAAQSLAADAAAQEMLEAAALPPGADSRLLGLDDLAHMQRGQGGSSEAAGRQLEQAQIAAQIALDARNGAETAYTDALAKYTKLNTELNTKQAAQQKLENANRDLLNAAEAAENTANSQLGAQYLAGSEAGRGADPHAIAALEFALSQRGKPYVWSTEGPSTYDCSGLMFAAYHSVGFNLVRVARDQYWQTRNKVVDRYSLLPGDLLFFSYSNSWRGIHHVAMYAGDGMMVEAPRTGLNVRLVPVRWTELFQATRVYGSVAGGATAPALGAADPQPTETVPPTHTTTPSHSATPTPSHSATPTPSHTTGPTTTPPTTSSPTTTAPTTTPTTPKPTGDPTTTSPSTTSPATGSSSAGSSSDSTSPSETGAAESKSTSASSSAASSKSASSSESSSAGTK